ncbi:MAG: Membrane protein YdfJ [Firmicutes bacterium]|nr:Membrane protein YdfJ [Bacillota bacterium]
MEQIAKPADMQTRQALSTMKAEFGLQGTAQVMVEELSIYQALGLKKSIEEIGGVSQVLWLDDWVDIATPLELMEKALVESYYLDRKALFQVVFQQDDHSLVTAQALRSISLLHNGEISLRGPAVDALATRQVASSEILMVSLFVIPIFLLILVVSTKSWLEPLLYVATIGIAILINMGTNALLGQISFLTQATAGLLQFAVTMDYSIFLLHRFSEERTIGKNPQTAMTYALKHSFSPITASSLTTVAGFAALMFMRYRIGFDMGLVMTKGVLLSWLAVMLFMPALAIRFAPLIEQTEHRSFFPNLSKFAGSVLRLRCVIPLFLLLLPLAYVAQTSNHFLYGDGGVPTEIRLEESFGIYNPLVLLVRSGDPGREDTLVTKLAELPSVREVQSLAMLADRAIPRSMLPSALVDNFQSEHYTRQSEHYTRMVVLLNSRTDTAEAFTTVTIIRKIVGTLYPGQYWMLGSAPAAEGLLEGQIAIKEGLNQAQQEIMRTIARPEVEKIVSFMAPEEARALSVQFVLRTPPISHLSKNNNSVIVNAEASTLWQRITNLFRKLVNIFRG